MEYDKFKSFLKNPGRLSRGKSLSGLLKNVPSVYLAILIFILLTLGGLLYIKVPNTIVTSGMVSALDQREIITSNIPGQIIQQFLRENQFVAKGDLLFVLDDQRVTDKIQYQQQLIKQNQIRIKDLSALINKIKASQAFNKVSWKKLQLGLPQRINWKIKIDSLHEKNKILQNSIAQLQIEQENYRIYSPHAGVLTHVFKVESGDYINPGQTLAVISKADSVEVHFWVCDQDIGTIQNEQNVSIQIGFPYQPKNFHIEKIICMDHHNIIPKPRVYYKILGRLDQQQRPMTQTFHMQLKKGMRGRVYITLSKQSILGWICDQLA